MVISAATTWNKVCMKGGKDIFTGEQEVEEWFVTQIRYERRIVIADKDYASTDAIYSF
jgi:hypothetical protein